MGMRRRRAGRKGPGPEEEKVGAQADRAEQHDGTETAEAADRDREQRQDHQRLPGLKILTVGGALRLRRQSRPVPALS